MPVEVIAASGKLLQVKFGERCSGRVEKKCLSSPGNLAREGTMRVAGPSRRVRGLGAARDWGDVSFRPPRKGRHIEKMAIVGDEKWRDEALALPPRDFVPRPSSSSPRLSSATERWAVDVAARGGPTALRTFPPPPPPMPPPDEPDENRRGCPHLRRLPRRVVRIASSRPVREGAEVVHEGREGRNRRDRGTRRASRP